MARAVARRERRPACLYACLPRNNFESDSNAYLALAWPLRFPDDEKRAMPLAVSERIDIPYPPPLLKFLLTHRSARRSRRTLCEPDRTR